MVENKNSGPVPSEGSVNSNPISSFSDKQSSWANIKDDISVSLAEIASSVRILEDRYLNLRRKSQLTDQNLIDLQREYYKEKRHLNDELIEIKVKLQDLLIDLGVIEGELKDVVRTKDFNVISSYLDFWEPIEFVTRKEVETFLSKKN